MDGDGTCEGMEPADAVREQPFVSQANQQSESRDGAGVVSGALFK